jgi:hypothetical protein
MNQMQAAAIKYSMDAPMKIRFVRFCVAFLLAGIVLPALHAKENQTAPFDVDQLLSQAPKKDFPWNIQVKTIQSSEERFLVQVKAIFYVSSLEGYLQRNLHFIVKIANSNKWVPGYSYCQITIPDTASYHVLGPIECNAKIYVRPGEYTVAFIAYDPIVKKGNFGRKVIKTPGLQKGFPPEPKTAFDDVEYFRSNDIEDPSSAFSDLFASEKLPEWMHVENKRRLCVDIVANASPDYHLNPQLGISVRRIPNGSVDSSRAFENPENWDQNGSPVYALQNSVSTSYSKNDNALQKLRVYSLIPIMQTASILSHLKLRDGNVRITVVDAFRVKTFFDRVNAADFDLKKAQEMVMKQNLNEVSIDDLNAYGKNAAFIKDKLQEIANDPCSSKAQTPLRIIILVNGQMKFPQQWNFPQFKLPAPDETKLFYIRYGEYGEDDIYKIIKDANPKIYRSVWLATMYPYIFQKKPSKDQLVLKDLVTYLESLTRQ